MNIVEYIFYLIFRTVNLGVLVYCMIVILPFLLEHYPEAHIGKLHNRYARFFILIFVIIGLLVNWFGDNGLQERKYSKWIFIAVTSGIGAYGIMLWRIAPRGIAIGIVSYGVGIFLNSLVVLLNDGKMPVLIDRNHYLASQVIAHNQYCFADANTKLAFLGDCIPIGHIAMVSVGDILVLSVPFILTITYVLKLRKRSV